MLTPIYQSHLILIPGSSHHLHDIRNIYWGFLLVSSLAITAYWCVIGDNQSIVKCDTGVDILMSGFIVKVFFPNEVCKVLDARFVRYHFYLDVGVLSLC